MAAAFFLRGPVYATDNRKKIMALSATSTTRAVIVRGDAIALTNTNIERHPLDAAPSFRVADRRVDQVFIAALTASAVIGNERTRAPPH